MDLIARSVCIWILASAAVGVAQLVPQDSSSASFHSQTSLVLVPFNVVRDKAFVSGLKSSDVTLLEDGRQHGFTVFEGPATGRPVPLELLLLFDTTAFPPSTPKGQIRSHWDREATYSFTKQWDEAISKEILGPAGTDVRISVYHFDKNQLQRLSHATRDPQELLAAFRRLLTPISGSDTIPLVLPPNRKDLALPGGFISGSPGWLLESVIGTLKDGAAAPDNAMRMLIVFSEGYGGTNTMPADAAGQATGLGIPVFPVVLDYDLYMRSPFAWSNGSDGREIRLTDTSPGEGWVPVGNLFGRLGELTGGASFDPPHVTAKVIGEIIMSVRNQGLTQYAVGFLPETRNPAKHRLEVRLKSKSIGRIIGGRRETTY